MFPMTIRQVRMMHSGGGKEHNFVLIRRSDGTSLAIHRYNKIGAWGQVAYQRGNFNACENFVEKKIREKERKASGGVYEVDQDSSQQVDNLVALERALNPQYVRALREKGHWEYLVGIASTPASGPEDEVPEPKVTTRIAKPKKDEPDPSANPNWGMF